MSTDLVLRLPTLNEEHEWLRAHRATTPDTPSFLHYYTEGMLFPRYLEVLDEQERGVNLPANHVPSTFLFAFVGDRIVGRASIRHVLNDFLFRIGGQIGYVVVPEFRRRGYATSILRQSLEIARLKLGLSRVLVTCDEGNIGSMRVIEKCGGVFENTARETDVSVPKRRYWIGLQ